MGGDTPAALSAFKAAAAAGEPAGLYYQAAVAERSALALGQQPAAADAAGADTDASTSGAGNGNDSAAAARAAASQAELLYWQAAERGEARALTWIGKLHWDRGQMDQAMECW